MRNCHSCIYHQAVPGDCHISCTYNWTNSEFRPPLANEHGIRKGWYIFPINFDPVWQEEECKAFSTVREEGKYIKNFNPLEFLMSFMFLKK